jgi:hypothetical protein
MWKTGEEDSFFQHLKAQQNAQRGSDTESNDGTVLNFKVFL